MKSFEARKLPIISTLSVRENLISNLGGLTDVLGTLLVRAGTLNGQKYRARRKDMYTQMKLELDEVREELATHVLKWIFD
ncbi:hypothetical protein GBA52_014884 [Prunus armeniaca]|nr:hypothetical protein GBA52_014884 [Prunus armeniaca]